MLISGNLNTIWTLEVKYQFSELKSKHKEKTKGITYWGGKREEGLDIYGLDIYPNYIKI